MSALHESCALCIELPEALPAPVIAVGSELKNTICAGQGSTLLVSPTSDDLSNADGFRKFRDQIDRFQSVINGHGSDLVWAHDLHPALTGTRFAAKQAGRHVAVQHHHAHAISCAIDVGFELPTLAIVCDGTGYGPDGAIWGGEVLFCDRERFQRAAHLDYFGLPGGDAASRQPWRPALSLLTASLPNICPVDLSVFSEIDDRVFRTVELQLRQRFNTPSCSSLGRLFDAAAWICGVAESPSSEGQAARALQSAAEGTGGEPFDFALIPSAEAILMDWRPMIRELLESRMSRVSVPTLAARFHATVIQMFTDAALQAADQTGIRRVVLSGGCFFNDILRMGMFERLQASGMEVATHHVVSPGDAGLSVGQAYIAAHTT